MVQSMLNVANTVKCPKYKPETQCPGEKQNKKKIVHENAWLNVNKIT